MKKVLLLGAGMVAKPIANYLLEKNIALTIASRTLSKAEKLINGHTNGTAISWTVDEMEKLDAMVAKNDLVVSLLPYKYHVGVAKLCIQHKVNMLTTSYVSDEMRALDADAQQAGIIILNEIGVDPGFDHMTAMRIIDKVKEEGGKIKEFYSLCGALAAPEETDNPFKYKFSWSPKGVILAGNNGAKYKKDGELVELPTKELFKNPLSIDFPEVGKMEVYPNRDSLAYIDLYKLNDVETMYRGTFRYPDWCEIMDGLKTLGLTDTEKVSFENKTYRKIMARQLKLYPANIKEKTAERLNVTIDSPIIVAMEWLGLFDDILIPFDEGSNFDMLADLMLKKMMLPKGGRDMVIMLHSFLIENAKGEEEVIKSYLLDYATEEDTSIARTVALPAAIGVKMILDGEIKDKGVQIPVSKSIYEPILNELETLGIGMNEQWGLPASEKLA